MDKKEIEVVNIDLHPQAEHLIEEHVNHFATFLLLQAKLLAFRRRDNPVLTRHVEEALDIISKEHGQGWLREQLFILIGGSFFGASIQGFITELSAGRALWIALYVGLGFLGILLVFWGLWSLRR